MPVCTDLCRDGVGGYQPAGGCVRFTDFIIADGEVFKRDDAVCTADLRIARFFGHGSVLFDPIDREGRTRKRIASLRIGLEKPDRTTLGGVDNLAEVNRRSICGDDDAERLFHRQVPGQPLRFAKFVHSVTHGIKGDTAVGVGQGTHRGNVCDRR